MSGYALTRPSAARSLRRRFLRRVLQPDTTEPIQPTPLQQSEGGSSASASGITYDVVTSLTETPTQPDPLLRPTITVTAKLRNDRPDAVTLQYGACNVSLVAYTTADRRGAPVWRSSASEPWEGTYSRGCIPILYGRKLEYAPSSRSARIRAERSRSLATRCLTGVTTSRRRSAPPLRLTASRFPRVISIWHSRDRRFPIRSRTTSSPTRRPPPWPVGGAGESDGDADARGRLSHRIPERLRRGARRLPHARPPRLGAAVWRARLAPDWRPTGARLAPARPGGSRRPSIAGNPSRSRLRRRLAISSGARCWRARITSWPSYTRGRGTCGLQRVPGRCGVRPGRATHGVYPCVGSRGSNLSITASTAIQNRGWDRKRPETSDRAHAGEDRIHGATSRH
jgi:hypothetical protein